MEAARPAVDSHVLELLRTRRFTRRDFAETARGVCRVVNPPLSNDLVDTGQRWAKAIAPAAEAVTQLFASIEGPEIKRFSAQRPEPVCALRTQAPKPREAAQASDSARADVQALRRPSSAARSHLLRRISASLPARAV
jgi:hypothetical protein